MGKERKRGKLAEFNRLLRGASDTSFVVQYGDLSILPSVRYVITLDSDTQLPMEAARKLVGTLSHPLNRPRFDPRLQRVTEGYGVLQPRIDVSVVSASRSAFSRIFSGHVGVDPYTTAVSDVYQDLFHEGSYVGKGIYDVDAFDAALAGRVPDNRLLSHDLFEGVLRAHGPLHGRQPRGRLPVALPVVRRAAASVDSRRLADRPLALAHGAGRLRPKGAEHAAGDRALEDPRQPAAEPAAAGAPDAPAGRMGVPSRIRDALDDARAARAGVSRLRPGRALSGERRAGRPLARAPARRAGQHRDQPAPVVHVHGAPGAPERGRARCDRADAGPGS